MAGPEIGFLASLLGTVVMLLCAAVAGRRRRIGVHVSFVAGAVLGLGTAVYFALKTGELYDLESAGMITPIHLTIARVTTLLYLWPLVTGPLVWAGRISPRLHRAGAWTVLALTLAATATGVAMLWSAERLV